MNVVHSLSRYLVVAPFLGSALFVACSSNDVGGPSGAATGVQSDQVEVVQGVPDNGAHPAVIAIDIGGTALCSGTLVAPDVVLTARHCVSKTIDAVACPAQGTKQILSDLLPSSLTILVGDEVSTAQPRATGKEIIVPEGDALCDADIALILLDQEIDDIDPLALSTAVVVKNDHVLAVGYGRSGDNQSAGNKLVREHVKVLGSSANEFLVGESTCQGDSGGPALDETTGEIVGVVSRGGAMCDGKDAQNIYTRADAFQSLIALALARSTAGAADAADAGVDSGADAGKKKRVKKDGGARKAPTTDMGAACTKGADCAAGVCVTANAKQYCSRTCATKDRCPTGFKCTAEASGGKVCVEK